MKTIKIVFLTPTRYVLVVSALLAPVLLICYAAFAQAHRSGDVRARTKTPASTLPQNLNANRRDNDPEFLERRREWLYRVLGYGPAGVLPEAYAKALRSRALPGAPLTQLWTLQAFSPLWNEWGLLGGDCTIPYPDPPDHSHCGASARIDAIAVDPNDEDVVYIGSEGGLAKSTDGGVTWSYLSDSLASQSFRSIAINPSAANIV